MQGIAARFWSKVRRDPSGCLIWTGAKQSRGYGHMQRGRRGEGTVLAHHVAWELAHGAPVPLGMTLDHLCARQCCVNVDHLEIVERGENTRRMLARHATPAEAPPDKIDAELADMARQGIEF